MQPHKHLHRRKEKMFRKGTFGSRLSQPTRLKHSIRLNTYSKHERDQAGNISQIWIFWIWEHRTLNDEPRQLLRYVQPLPSIVPMDVRLLTSHMKSDLPALYLVNYWFNSKIFMNHFSLMCSHVLFEMN